MKKIYILASMMLILLTSTATSSESTYTNQYLAGDSVFQVNSEQRQNGLIEVWISSVGDNTKNCSDTIKLLRLDALYFNVEFSRRLSTRVTGISPTTQLLITTQIFRDIDDHFKQNLVNDRVPSGTLSYKPLVFPNPINCNAYAFECEDCDKESPKYLRVLQKEYDLYRTLYHTLQRISAYSNITPYRTVIITPPLDTTTLVQRNRKPYSANFIEYFGGNEPEEYTFSPVVDKPLDTVAEVKEYFLNYKKPLIDAYNNLYAATSAIYIHKFAEGCKTCPQPFDFASHDTLIISCDSVFRDSTIHKDDTLRIRAGLRGRNTVKDSIVHHDTPFKVFVSKSCDTITISSVDKTQNVYEQPDDSCFEEELKQNKNSVEKYYQRNLALLEELTFLLIDKIKRNKTYSVIEVDDLENIFRSITSVEYTKPSRRLYFLYNAEKMFIDGLIDLDTTILNNKEIATSKRMKIDILNLRKIQQQDSINSKKQRAVDIKKDIERDGKEIPQLDIRNEMSKCKACKESNDCKTLQLYNKVEEFRTLINKAKSNLDSIEKDKTDIWNKEDEIFVLVDEIGSVSETNSCFNALKKIVNHFWGLHDAYLRLSGLANLAHGETNSIADLEKKKNVLENSIKTLLSVDKQPLRNFLKVDSVQFEFEGGTIKNIIVTGTYNGKDAMLLSRSPIPFSVLADQNRFSGYKLYDPTYNQYVVSSDRIFKYIPHLVSRSEDYSPADTVVTFRENDPAKVMLKHSIKEILRAKVYTDFMGTVEGNPNGLVQMEVGYKFNFWSRYFKFILPVPCCPDNNKHNIKPNYVGFLNYYLPTLSWTKIEQKERSLEILTTDSLILTDKTSTVRHLDPEKNRKYVSSIDILRYSYFNLKPLNFNIISYHVPAVKMALHWDIGTTWYITSLKDTLAAKVDTLYYLTQRKYNVNSTSINSEIIWDYRPHPSININFSVNFMWFRMWDKRFEQAADPESYQIYLSEKRNTGEWMFNPSFTVSLFPIPKKIDGDIYFRTAYTSLLPSVSSKGNHGEFRQNLGQNFFQTQIGISVRIMK